MLSREQVLWALCVYVEAVSVLPQLRMMQKAKVRPAPCPGMKCIVAPRYISLLSLTFSRNVLNARGRSLACSSFCTARGHP